ncbi:MAG: hypothetical protein V3U20_08655 [Thermoplasmata archaeon]
MKRIHTLILTTVIIIIVVLAPPASFSYPLSSNNQVCEECHSDFEAFSITIDAPSEVPEDYDFEFRVIVRNHEEHEVRDLEAVIDLSEAPNLEPALRGEPYHEEIAGSVSFGGSEGFSFPVLEAASSAAIILDGDEGLLGRNDIDLFVESPSGEVWDSTSPGADENVNLNANNLRRGGVGDYFARVDYFVGGLSISFTLTIDVEYSTDQIFLQGSDLGPGEEYTFVLPLKSKAQGDNTINVIVTGTAYHEHEENDDPLITDSDEYTYEESSNLRVGNRFVYEPPEGEFEFSVNILLLERITGLLSALLLVLSIGLCGYYRPLCSRIEKITGGKAKRCKWHCRVSLVLLLISFIHGLMLPFSPYASTLRGLVLGTSAFMILGALGYIGWQQNSFKKRWGYEKWCRVHMLLTVAVVVIVVAHALLDGSDFSWLR